MENRKQNGNDFAMGFQLRWAEEADQDRIAVVRLQCYGSAEKDLELYQKRLRENPISQPGDFLLAEDKGHAVGTATSLSMQMCVRGSVIPCQGVAWVGTIKTMRRRGGGSEGVATTIMKETLRRGREREQIVSALMPFRVSFYEHFGYGIIERRCEWTLPISVLPSGPFDGMRFYEPANFDARAQCLERINHLGQCDVLRTPAMWKFCTEQARDGLQIVDRPTDDSPVRGSMHLTQQQINAKDHLHVQESVYEDIAALKRQLHFLASLRDQYSTVHLTLPIDVPLNRLLKETQIPHRPVNHATGEARPYSRMQLRVLDHRKFLEALHLPADANGSAIVSVHECEGTVSRFKLEIQSGKISVSGNTSGAPEFICSDRTWAAVACGDLSAGDALRFGLAEGSSQAAEILNALGRGPVPFCHEYF